MKKIEKCPICGSQGEDLIFAFYCSNENCQNYKRILEKDFKKENNAEEFSYWTWPIREDDD